MSPPVLQFAKSVNELVSGFRAKLQVLSEDAGDFTNQVVPLLTGETYKSLDTCKMSIPFSFQSLSTSK